MAYMYQEDYGDKCIIFPQTAWRWFYLQLNITLKITYTITLNL